jgi:hypothetical protein
MQRLLIALVRFYRFALSPWLGSSCRFEPTCSAYALQALAAHGAAAGSALVVAAWRAATPGARRTRSGAGRVAPLLHRLARALAAPAGRAGPRPIETRIDMTDIRRTLLWVIFSPRCSSSGTRGTSTRTAIVLRAAARCAPTPPSRAPEHAQCRLGAHDGRPALGRRADHPGASGGRPGTLHGTRAAAPAVAARPRSAGAPRAGR